MFYLIFKNLIFFFEWRGNNEVSSIIPGSVKKLWKNKNDFMFSFVLIQYLTLTNLHG